LGLGRQHPAGSAPVARTLFYSPPARIKSTDSPCEWFLGDGAGDGVAPHPGYDGRSRCFAHRGEWAVVYSAPPVEPQKSGRVRDILEKMILAGPELRPTPGTELGAGFVARGPKLGSRACANANIVQVYGTWGSTEGPQYY